MEDEEVEVVTVSAGDVAKLEITRQAVILGFSIVGTVAIIYVQRKFSDPDSLSTMRMWGALVVKRWADRQAVRFTNLATHMANVYNGEKL